MARADSRRQTRRRAAKPSPQSTVTDPPQTVDLHVDAPLVKVDQINLEVDELQAHVALLTGLAHILRLNVGVSARAGKVRLNIEGVEAQALLEARLHNVAAILARVLSSVDDNPQLLRSVEQGLGDVTSGTGDILEGTGDTARTVVGGAKKLAPGKGF